MSHYATAVAMKVKGLKPATKIVLYWLSDHYNDETKACFPSLSKLASECEMSRQSVVRHIDILEEIGLVSRRHRKRENGSQTSTEYILNFIETTCQNLERGLSKFGTGGLSNFDTPITLEDKNLVNEQEGRAENENDLFHADPSLSTERALSESKESVEKGFEEFWNRIWPSHERKKAKADCRKVYIQACTGKHPKADALSPKDLNEAARRYIASVRDKQYLKGTLPWLREPGWEPFIGQGQSHVPMDPDRARYQRIIREYS